VEVANALAIGNPPRGYDFSLLRFPAGAFSRPSNLLSLRAAKNFKNGNDRFPMTGPGIATKSFWFLPRNLVSPAG